MFLSFFSAHARLLSWAVPLGLLAFMAASLGGYSHGVDVAATRCKASTSAAVVQGQQQAASAAQVVIAKSAQVGRAREVFRAQVDRTFDTFIQEAAREPVAPVDDCMLPDDRLRRWAAANAGTTDTGTAAAELDEPAPPPAGPGIRPHARPGSQPLGSGEGLPPSGEPALPAAAVSGPLS